MAIRRLGAQVISIFARVRRRLSSRKTILTDRTVQRIDKEFEAIVDKAVNELRGSVPVRTGKMKMHVRRFAARGVNKRVLVYSDAKNTSGREYAIYVNRYHAALRRTLEMAQKRINRRRVRIEIEIGRLGGGTHKSISHAKMSSFMVAGIEGHRIFFTLSNLRITRN